MPTLAVAGYSITGSARPCVQLNRRAPPSMAWVLRTHLDFLLIKRWPHCSPESNEKRLSSWREEVYSWAIMTARVVADYSITGYARPCVVEREAVVVLEGKSTRSYAPPPWLRTLTLLIQSGLQPEWVNREAVILEELCLVVQGSVIIRDSSRGCG
ncbi:hypothetical protein BC826DRAFT_994707 [Russula brevipes]|nr:hypothetical protein BC826DRAFT_994707 [Russula brevipes]